MMAQDVQLHQTTETKILPHFSKRTEYIHSTDEKKNNNNKIKTHWKALQSFLKDLKKKEFFLFFFLKKALFEQLNGELKEDPKKQDKDRSTLTILNFITILEAVVEAKMKTHSKLCILHHASHLC